MIDYQTYKKMHPKAFNKTPKTPTLIGHLATVATTNEPEILRFDHHPKSIHRDENIDEENLILLPPEIHGYLFQEKQWGWFLCYTYLLVWLLTSRPASKSFCRQCASGEV